MIAKSLKIRLFFLLLIFIYSCGQYNFNGKILEKEKISFNNDYEKHFLQKIDMSTNDFVMYKITYLSDGLKVKGYFGKPKNLLFPHPAIIYNRGGNREFGKLTPLQLLKYIKYGYIVIGSQYRGNDGGEGREEFGGNDVNDVLNLIPILEDDKQVDRHRIYMVGYSRGGMMTYLALTKTDKIKAACVIGGIADLFMTEKNRPDMHPVLIDLIGGLSKNFPMKFKKRSAIYYADKINTPLLILHGDNDWRVNYKQSLKMANALKRNNKKYKIIIYSGGNHYLSNFYYESLIEQVFFLQ